MPRLENLKKLASREITPAPPSWPLVFHLLISNNSPNSSSLGASVAASGEASIFSYARNSIEPMYFSTIGGIQRLKEFTGYEVKNLRSTDAEEVFAFIKEAVDSGSGLFAAGPEAGLCYGYDDPGPAEKREVYGFSNWGPALNGTVPWQTFIKYAAAFGDTEGFACLGIESHPVSAGSILEMIAAAVIGWQEKHPAVSFGMKQEYYGLPAFRKFIEDIRDPQIRPKIDEAYISCHVIQSQTGGRYWLGKYLKQLSVQFTADMQNQILEIGDLYLTVFNKLKQFVDLNIAENRSEEEIQKAVNRLEEAYYADEQILDEFISLRKKV